eukprot:gene7182-9793_t
MLDFFKLLRYCYFGSRKNDCINSCVTVWGSKRNYGSKPTSSHNSRMNINRSLKPKIKSIQSNNSSTSQISSNTVTNNTMVLNNQNEYLTSGSIVEFVSAKGSKQLGLVSQVFVIPPTIINNNNISIDNSYEISDNLKNIAIEVINESKKCSKILGNNITYIINGKYYLGDLIRLQEMMSDTSKLPSLDRLWEYSKLYYSQTGKGINITEISQYLFKSNDAIRTFITIKLLQSDGKIYFTVHNTALSVRDGNNPHKTLINPINVQYYPSIASEYYPNSNSIVDKNIKYRFAFKEFKTRYLRYIAASKYNDKKGKNNSNYYSYVVPEVSFNNGEILMRQCEGLKDIVFKDHPWVTSGFVNYKTNDEEILKAIELLDYLNLQINSQNAKLLLQIMGVWSIHENMEKHLLNISDKFPESVIDEANNLLLHYDTLEDYDERLRRDLRYLSSYSIDREGATEIDDAVSIEYLSDGQEKLWVHIADVSRWIRPGSQLSIEAERRMSSIYMPDERIPMFPEKISSELLSLGAKESSYALSCGVTLNSEGEVISYEVCPSKIKITKQLNYAELDEIIGKYQKKKSLQMKSSKLSNKNSKSDSNNNINNKKKSKSSNRISIDMIVNEAENQYLESRLKQLNSNNSEGGTNNDMTITDQNNDDTSYSEEMDQQNRLDVSDYDVMVENIGRLNDWAAIRNDYRRKNGALDKYLRHKTDLYLTVKRDLKNQRNKFDGVTGYLTWSNSSAVSLVSEYMIMMSQTIGSMCIKIDAPVWYKIQICFPPIPMNDLELRENENTFLRAARIMKSVRGATDSKLPGEHCTSGSTAYVQCTSPIRRYHDLYNHYRLKGAMHAASLGEMWAEKAKEEAGIQLLDSMATAEERLKKLHDIKLVTKQRTQYWMSIYINSLYNTSPKPTFNCMIFSKMLIEDINNFIGQIAHQNHHRNSMSSLATAPSPSTEFTSLEDSDEPWSFSNNQTTQNYNNNSYNNNNNNNTSELVKELMKQGDFYFALIMELGSFIRYDLFIPKSSLLLINNDNKVNNNDNNNYLSAGDFIKCELWKKKQMKSYNVLSSSAMTMTMSSSLANDGYMLLPEATDMSRIPSNILSLIELDSNHN